ncbi:MAG: HPr [Planctomycetota bacterium]|nr:MAG: HPr [Planctomycetota bacterium]
MPRYAVFGLSLASDIEFPELTPAAEYGAPAAFRLRAPACPSSRNRWVLEIPRENGAPWLSVGRAGDAMLLRFHGVADFHFAHGGLDVEARPAPGASIDDVRWHFLDHVLPRALAASGRTVLHASAVETDRGALVFVGESGSGKSTLAASFCAAGARLLSDDGVLIDTEMRVVPAYPVHRLWPAALPVLGSASVLDSKEKQRRAPSASAWRTSSVPLFRVFVLAPHIPGREWIERASGAEAMLALVRQAYRLDPTDRDRAGAEFRFLGQLSAAFPALILAHPRTLADLQSVQIKICEFSS